MEADSTTSDLTSKSCSSEKGFPFSVRPGNLKVFSDLVPSKCFDSQGQMKLVITMQSLGLIPKTMKCPKGGDECEMKLKTARVVDRVQWICMSCNTKVPIRYGTFFYKLQCSLYQALQVILAWSEDADCTNLAAALDIKNPSLVTKLYDRLDELAISATRAAPLGGPDSVVLLEMYPDCLNRQSPDTTDQPLGHQILMMADTNYIPTRYRLHIMKDAKNLKNDVDDTDELSSEISQVVRDNVIEGSFVVSGSRLVPVEGTVSVHDLLAQCDADMAHFLCSRIWRQAITLCVASRDLCACTGKNSTRCAAQRYLDAAVHRLANDQLYYAHVLGLVADETDINGEQYVK